MGTTSIEWTDQVWNCVVGCKRVSAGCDHCYAFQLHDQRHVAWKRGRMPNAPAQYHKPFSQVQLLPQRLDAPLGWRKPRKVFVNSMSDMWHDDIPDTFIARMFAYMAATPQHTYQILTKRPQRMHDLMNMPAFKEAAAAALSVIAEFDGRAATNTIDAWPLPNVWLGVSTENQETADERIPLLMRTLAVVRFISAEPLLGPIDLTRIPCPNGCHSGEYCALCCNDYSSTDFGFVNSLEMLHWVIVGGESGPHFRVMDTDWARSLRDQCWRNDVAYFFKQSSGMRSGTGRELDGRTWDEYPVQGSAV